MNSWCRFVPKPAALSGLGFDLQPGSLIGPAFNGIFPGAGMVVGFVINKLIGGAANPFENTQLTTLLVKPVLDAFKIGDFAAVPGLFAGNGTGMYARVGPVWNEVSRVMNNVSYLFPVFPAMAMGYALRYNDPQYLTMLGDMSNGDNQDANYLTGGENQNMHAYLSDWAEKVAAGNGLTFDRNSFPVSHAMPGPWFYDINPALLKLYNELLVMKQQKQAEVEARLAAEKAALDAANAAKAAQVATPSAVVAPAVTPQVAPRPVGANRVPQPGEPGFDWAAWRIWLARHTAEMEAAQRAQMDARSAAMLQAERDRQNALATATARNVTVTIPAPAGVSGLTVIDTEQQPNGVIDAEFQRVLNGIGQRGLKINAPVQFPASKLFRWI